MATWILKLCLAVLLVVGSAGPSLAQGLVPFAFWHLPTTARYGASLDLDFVRDTYFLNGTTYTAGSGNTGVQNFIAGSGATFTRAGTTNNTSTLAPFYLNSGMSQSFVSRATVTNNVTSTFAPFYIGTTGNGPSQSFVSRADSSDIATYFNSSGVLTTVSSAGAARSSAYYYSGGSWVLGGTLIEPASTNQVTNNTMSGAAAAGTVNQLITNGTFTSCSGTYNSGNTAATSCNWSVPALSGSAAVTFTTGNVALAGDGTNAASIYQSVTTASGVFYNLTISNASGNAVSVQVGTTSTGSALLAATTVAASTTTILHFNATGTTSYVQISNTNATAANITTVSVQNGGKLPTYWAFSAGGGGSGVGLAMTVIGTGTYNGVNYVDIQFAATTTSTENLDIYPQGTGTVTATVGQAWTTSMFTQITSDCTCLASANMYVQTLQTKSNPTAETGARGASANLDSTRTTWQQSSGTITATVAGTTSIRPNLGFTSIAAGTVNFTIRIGMPQLEQNPYATSVIATSSAAVTRAADVYQQQPASYFDSSGNLWFTPYNTARTNYTYNGSSWVNSGTLIEPAATNSITNNMMVGAVAADGVERTNNGTFSNTSPNACSGSVTSSTYTMSCYNGNTVTAQTISSITYSSTTATVTTSAAHGLAVGNIVTVSGASPSNYNGTFMVASVTSTTKFTYTMASAPSSNASPVGSYTATAGGWMGTINSGTGTVSAAAGAITLTGDGTNAASIYEGIPTIAGYTYNITLTTGAGGAVTVQAGSTVGGVNRLAADAGAASTTTNYSFIANSSIMYVQINNTSATAATVTTVSVQSGGLPPTGWSLNLSATLQNGLSVKILDTGTLAGIPYFDVQYTGTPSGAGNASCQFEGNSAVAAAQNQTWTNSMWVALNSGSLTGISVNILTGENNSSGTFLVNGYSTVTPTSTLTRYSYTRKLSNSSTAYTYTQFDLGLAATAINATFRVGMPQLEESSYTTMPIPTFGSTVTRTADVFQTPNGGSYYNSSGTLVVPAASTPRLDYGVLGGNYPLGILLEAGTQNLIYPSAMNFNSWTLASTTTITDNSATSPDGSTDAATMTTSAGYSYALTCSPTSISTGQPYTASIFVKPGSVTGSQIIVAGGNSASSDGGFGKFSPTTGACSQCGAQAGGTCIACGSQTLTNGWYRMWVTFETASATQGCTGIETGYNTTGTLYLYGGQLEYNAMTSYIPTVGAQITRSQDVFTLPTTAYSIAPQTISSMTDTTGTATVTTSAPHGLAVNDLVVVTGTTSSIYNGTFQVATVPSPTTFTYQMLSDPGGSATTVGSYTTAWYTAAANGGTLEVTGDIPYFNSAYNQYPGYAAIDDGTTNNSIDIYMCALCGSGEKSAEIFTGGSNVYEENLGSPYYIEGNMTKGLIAFQTNSVNSAFDGTLGTLSTSATMPTVSTLRIGANRGNTWPMEGWVNHVWYMPSRQPDNTLANYTQ